MNIFLYEYFLKIVYFSVVVKRTGFVLIFMYHFFEFLFLKALLQYPVINQSLFVATKIFCLSLIKNKLQNTICSTNAKDNCLGTAYF